ncbi:helix-turn-helix transcriptional regulator [Micromonospora sp. M71_S20]|uniref:helix-turn-helix transcriptional regulator n=1 Tax=Micromonospora sp. M71_S20 TaxID=592872 RepID=UPI00131590F8|nr:helix-turn-helix transcriptional regulator [Micromonospora sp. M71_S20]
MRNTATHDRGAWASLVTKTRERVGMNKSELARRLGIDRTTIIRWESGKSRPEDPTVVEAFAQLFGLDADEVLTAAGLRTGSPSSGRSTSDPPLDPDLVIIMRRLNDPLTPDAERATLRATLRYLAELADQAERGRGRAAG